MSEVTYPTQVQDTSPNESSTIQSTPGSVVHQMISNTQQSHTTDSTGEISINGQYYTPMGRAAHMAICYNIVHLGTGFGALVDGGTNGGLARDDIRILKTDPLAKVDVMGIGDKVFDAMPIVQCAGLVDTANEGTIVTNMCQYAHHGTGKTIHSKNQMEAFGCLIFDSSQWHGSHQLIVTLEGNIIPLSVRNLTWTCASLQKQI